MAPSLTVHELLRYTGEERDRWRLWFVRHPEAVDAAFQPGTELATVGRLIDHIFLVERQHLQRLMEEPVTGATGLTGHNAPPLFDYGASVRRQLEGFLAALDEDVADEVRSFDVFERQWPMTPRKLLFHMLVHEIRHWAQVALAVRLAGYEPPGNHDIFYSTALR